ncbi:MAG: aspartate kinase, partial [Bacteroidales bacterium]|nr:aspartate kinase [Bacteroidales bacterium]
ISFNEAIELAYYGASVIHPKTVKPIQNKGIQLNIKSFLDPSANGSVIGPFDSIEPLTPLYIFKNNQILISIQPKDFSFIAEENLQTIFAVLAKLNIRVNLMQNSALSFSLCLDYNEILLDKIRERLESQFRLVYNTGLQLITIRYYNQQIIDEIVDGRTILLQQRSRTTTQLLVDSK